MLDGRKLWRAAAHDGKHILQDSEASLCQTYAVVAVESIILLKSRKEFTPKSNIRPVKHNLSFSANEPPGACQAEFCLPLSKDTSHDSAHHGNALHATSYVRDVVGVARRGDGGYVDVPSP